MKRILLLLTLLSVPLVNANIYRALDEFIKGERMFKKEHFESEKAFMNEKLNLLARQHSEKFDAKLADIRELEENGFSEELLKKCLKHKIELCKKHLIEWKELCDRAHRRSEESYRKGMAMLNNFEQRHMHHMHEEMGYMELEPGVLSGLFEQELS